MYITPYKNSNGTFLNSMNWQYLYIKIQIYKININTPYKFNNNNVNNYCSINY